MAAQCKQTDIGRMNHGGPRSRSLRLLLTALLMSLSVAPLAAFEFFGIDLNIGYSTYFNGHRVDEDGILIEGSDVDPLNFTFGVGASFEFAPLLRFSPALDVFWQNFLLLDDGKVVPTQSENINAASVTTLLLSIPWTHHFELGEGFGVGFAVSPTLVFRIPTSSESSTDLAGTAEYFYSELRFFYPEAQLWVGYELNDAIDILLSFRALMPIHNLWTRFNVPIADELMTLLFLKLRFKV